MLLTTRTCPNCKIAGKMLTDAGIKYRTLLAEEDEGADMATRYHIQSAPTLFVPNGEDMRVIGSVSGIRGYVDSVSLHATA